MSLPVDRFVVGSNSNDILARFFESGELRMADVVPTLSPSMDIQVSSNLERLLFELYGRDGSAVADMQTRFRAEGDVAIDEFHHQSLSENWLGARIDDEGPDGTKAIIADVFERTGVLLDPHTAVGVGAARLHAQPGTPMITLATAHPAKFPDAVEAATANRPGLPEHLSDLFERTEHCSDPLPNDLATIQTYVEQRARVLQ